MIKTSLFGKIDIPAILLSWAVMYAVGLAGYIFLITCLSPTVYFYLGEDTYAHNAFPIGMEYLLDIISGLTGGIVVARLSRQSPLINAVIVGLIDTALDLYISRDHLLVDPLWYTLTANGSHFASVLMGAFVAGYLCHTRFGAAASTIIKKRNLALHFVVAVCALVGLFAVGLHFHANLKDSPPEAMVQQLEKLALDGDKQANRELGKVYFFGNSKDIAKAAKFYREAAQQGDTYSQLMLSGILLQGEGVPQDNLAAYEWLSVAKINGSRLAVLSLDTAKSRLSPDELVAADKWVADWKPVIPSSAGATDLK